MKIQIPVENTVDVIFGDVYIDLDIKIVPCSYPTREQELFLSKLNTRLGSLAYECKKSIEKTIEKELK